MAATLFANRSRFDTVTQAKAIEVFEVARKCREDPNASKVNLSVGAYRDDDGKPWVLPVVRTVEEQMAHDKTLDHEYLPIAGLPSLRDESVKLVLGESSPALVDNRAFGVQALSGTGALRIGAEFLKRFGAIDTVLCSLPTWGNHLTIFRDCGFANVTTYRYWAPKTRSLDFEGMKEDLNAAENGAVVVLHGCCHNPTGVDPSMDQWKELATIIRSKGHFPFFDCAYLGFGTGNVDVDAEPVRYFVAEGFELFVAQSYAKNFGLYNERAGNLTVVTSDPKVNPMILSQFELIIRPLWSNPPNHGARIVATILSNETFKDDWRKSVKAIADRILLMRRLLNQKLKELGTPGNWDHVLNQKGMFTYTGLNEQQCRLLTDKHHIYLLKSGRINMAGLTTKNVGYVAKAFHDVCTMPPEILANGE